MQGLQLLAGSSVALPPQTRLLAVQKPAADVTGRVRVLFRLELGENHAARNFSLTMLVQEPTAIEASELLKQIPLTSSLGNRVSLSNYRILHKLAPDLFLLGLSQLLQFPLPSFPLSTSLRVDSLQRDVPHLGEPQVQFELELVGQRRLYRFGFEIDALGPDEVMDQLQRTLAILPKELNVSYGAYVRFVAIAQPSYSDLQVLALANVKPLTTSESLAYLQEKVQFNSPSKVVQLTYTQYRQFIHQAEAENLISLLAELTMPTVDEQSEQLGDYATEALATSRSIPFSAYERLRDATHSDLIKRLNALAVAYPDPLVPPLTLPYGVSIQVDSVEFPLIVEAGFQRINFTLMTTSQSLRVALLLFVQAQTIGEANATIDAFALPKNLSISQDQYESAVSAGQTDSANALAVLLNQSLNFPHYVGISGIDLPPPVEDISQFQAGTDYLTDLGTLLNKTHILIAPVTFVSGSGNRGEAGVGARNLSFMLSAQNVKLTVNIQLIVQEPTQAELQQQLDLVTISLPDRVSNNAYSSFVTAQQQSAGVLTHLRT
ncbi:unnamed protein product [Didymodactylos carnosus]|uniref:Uncharacterized protein n=1 Tax=Didymodactylos carnosus TaxID=1234261 RepID=A0A8S2KBP0_9BILA|nr:unnamed protein product [Didymodactylos carnosus]CAF3834640.1 unnamed protein product [Didymodactylos carnosus]